MRKALITLILAATAATPVAALAQDDNGRAERIRERTEQRQQARTERREQRSEARAEQPAEARVERREQRVERRQERVEQRVDRRQARQEPQVQVQQSVPIRAFNRRGERNLSRSTNGGISADPRLTARQDRRDDRRDTRQDRREDRRDWRQDRREDRRDWRQDRRADRRDWSREWNRSSWRGDRRYDWQGWRYRNRSLFRLSPYFSPYRSHRYSRFSIGLFLEPLFYSQRYWLNDPYQYRLPYAPPGTQWVRYYNDVLLVDVYSGEVVDVIYNYFW